MRTSTQNLSHIEEPVVPLRLVSARGGSPPKNWLADLPEGSVFHSRPRNPEFAGNGWSCRQYRIIHQYEASTSLWDILDFDDDSCYDLVDSYAFSEGNILVEVIEYGNSNRTD